MAEMQKGGNERPPDLLNKISKLGPDDTLEVTPEECAEALQQLFLWVEELDEEEGDKA